MYVKGTDGGTYRAAPQIPANYGGNAFTADEDQTAANQNIEAEAFKKETDLPTATDKGGFAADDLFHFACELTCVHFRYENGFNFGKQCF